jgi:hypothetical protein
MPGRKLTAKGIQGLGLRVNSPHSMARRDFGEDVMSLDRVFGQPFAVLGGHAVGRRGHWCFRRSGFLGCVAPFGGRPLPMAHVAWSCHHALRAARGGFPTITSAEEGYRNQTFTTSSCPVVRASPFPFRNDYKESSRHNHAFGELLKRLEALGRGYCGAETAGVSPTRYCPKTPYRSLSNVAQVASLR